MCGINSSVVVLRPDLGSAYLEVSWGDHSRTYQQNAKRRSPLYLGGSDRTYPHNLVSSGDEFNASRSEPRLCSRQDNRKELDEMFVKDFFFYLCSSDLFHLYHLNNCNCIFCLYFILYRLLPAPDQSADWGLWRWMRE